ncbi:hypothetical protein BFP97_20055 [Roseivirga sp. 4D4]|uniref:hypothetical protein n=1 Tax=Roseivirga sp. 4D4 TaxID=1889784 RepID=UPI000852F9F6|nr:hypothetical protein [Roseivirga sp. 4D4]OEK03671.1 hypothetical protein BFP97_20055 [Roseivirga sp. 4D4]
MKKLRPKKITLVFILSLLLGCSSNQHKDDEIYGAWMYFDNSGMYNEVLIGDDFYITHNDVIGTTASQLLKRRRSSIVISDFDDTPVTYNFQFESDGKLLLWNDLEEFKLTPIKVNIDMKKFANDDFDEMDKYDQGFESRKSSAEGIIL